LAGVGEEIPLLLRQILYDAGQSLNHVYFPISGLVSLSTYTTAGISVEIATVGRNGVVGLERALGEVVEWHRATVLVPGTAVRMDATQFIESFNSDPGFRRRVLAYLGERLRESAQLAVCNRLHSVESRLARWFLSACHRGDTLQVAVTHDELARLLGVRRSTVTLTTGKFQDDGLIHYRRGHVEIEDQTGLERIACECYPMIMGSVTDVQRNQFNDRRPSNDPSPVSRAH
jgi:CRP-like cAMP-binding protein